MAWKWKAHHDEVVANYVRLHPLERPELSALNLQERWNNHFDYDHLLHQVKMWRAVFCPEEGSGEGSR